MDTIENLSGIVVQTLKTMKLAGTYASEENDFMPVVIGSLEQALTGAGITNFSLTGSVGGRNRARVDLLGTNFWPDIELIVDSTPLIAIELKLGRKGLASAISQTLGQLLIYQLKYPAVVGFVAHSANEYPKLHEYDEAFNELCSNRNLPIVVRRLGDV